MSDNGTANREHSLARRAFFGRPGGEKALAFVSAAAAPRESDARRDTAAAALIITHSQRWRWRGNRRERHYAHSGGRHSVSLHSFSPLRATFAFLIDSTKEEGRTPTKLCPKNVDRK